MLQGTEETEDTLNGTSSNSQIILLTRYKRKKAPFGFNGLGELVYMRTYSRIKDDGKNERWWETVQRVVEGTIQYAKELD